MILAAVVVYKAPREDRSVIEGITCHDVDVISRAQFPFEALDGRNVDPTIARILPHL